MADLPLEEIHTEGGRTPEERARECLHWVVAPWDQTAAKAFPRAQQLARDVLLLLSEVTAQRERAEGEPPNGWKAWWESAEAHVRALTFRENELEEMLAESRAVVVGLREQLQRQEEARLERGVTQHRGADLEYALVRQGWLDDIERALRDIFTSSSDEDEAFDNATRSLDSLRASLLAQDRHVADYNHIYAERDDLKAALSDAQCRAEGYLAQLERLWPIELRAKYLLDVIDAQIPGNTSEAWRRGKEELRAALLVSPHTEDTVS